MRRFVLRLVAACLSALLAVPTLALAAADPATRTIVAGPFVVRWSLSNPEAITYLSWNGSTNLTSSWGHPNCPTGGVHEFFGNSWGTDNDVAFLSPVGWGSAGTWTPRGAQAVDIASSASGCFGTSSIPVTTTYGFFGATAGTGRIQVERRFSFGVTPFAMDLRPYIPRLAPTSQFSQVLFPNQTGSVLLTRSAFDCGLGCRVTDWNGAWFAVHDPSTGRGMIVRHEASTYPAILWVDQDGGSGSTATSVALLQSGAGFTGTVVDRQILCFYDGSIWVPGLGLPDGCSVAWSDGSPTLGSKLGLPVTPGAYSTATKVSPLSRYVTWQADFGPDAAGTTIGVLVAVRRADGTFGPFTRLTGRVADAQGIVTFSRREVAARWISVRFQFESVLSPATQARWR